MGIKGLTDGTYLKPKIKRIRLGVLEEMEGKNKFGGTKTKPVNTKHFVIDPQECPEIVEVYGENPVELHAVFVGSIDQIMPTNYMYYMSGPKGDWFLNCIGDGEDAAWYATHLVKTPLLDINRRGMTDGKERKNSFYRKCLGQDCPDAIAKRCKPTAFIRFYLPLVDTTTLYEIVTHSVNTMAEFYSMLSNLPPSNGMMMGPAWILSKSSVSKKKVNDERSGFASQNFQYLTLKRDPTFWEKYGDKVLAVHRKVYGLDFVEKLRSFSKNESNTTDEHKQLTYHGHMETWNVDTTDNEHQTDANDYNEHEKTTATVGPSEMRDTESKDLEENKQEAISLENDPDIIRAVEQMYQAVGTKVPDGAVSNAIKKFGNKETILSEVEKFLNKKGVKLNKVSNKKESQNAEESIL